MYYSICATTYNGNTVIRSIWGKKASIFEEFTVTPGLFPTPAMILFIMVLLEQYIVQILHYLMQTSH
jgi:hypothetical protein